MGEKGLLRLTLIALLGASVIASACVSQGSYQELLTQLTETQRQVSAQQAEVARLSAALSEEQAKSNYLNSQLSALKTELAATQARAAGSETQLATAQSTVSGFESQLSSMKGELSTVTGKASALEGQLAKALSSWELEKRDGARLSTELAEAKNTGFALNRQIESTKSELAQARDANANLNQQIGALKSQLGILQSAVKAPTAGEIVAKVRPGIVRIKSSEGSGSGFFFDKEGRILTNSHVVGVDKKVTVIVDDKTSIEADVVGRDDVKDLAVLKSSIRRDVSLSLADSDKVAAGDEVLVIGYPLGSILGGQASLTKGVVSAKRQDGGVSLIQVDASLNPGSSGGPLLNGQGDAIGVVVAVIRETAGAAVESIGFAVASNTVKDALPSLLAGKITTAPQDWKNYRNTTWSYSIQIPSDWSVNDSDKDNAIFRSRDGNATVIVQVDLLTWYSLNQYTDAVMRFRRSLATIFVEHSRTPLVLPGGVSAYYLLSTYAYAGMPEARKMISVTATSGGRNFEVRAITWDSKWERHGAHLEKISKSFAPQP